MRVHLVSPNDNWILQKIASKLMEITEVQMSNSQEIDHEVDLNYFVNWCYWKILYPKLDKPEKTLVFFTHFDSHSEKYMDVLEKADNIVAMSLHGKEVLLNQNIAYEKIHVIEGFGTLDDLPYRKIKLGISSRPKADGRKGEDIILKLMEELDSGIFQFSFMGKGWLPFTESMVKNNVIFPINIWYEPDTFFNNIDYWFSPSYAEGGPMDLLNAVKCGIPVISRDIGFFKELKTSEDIVFDKYDDLLQKLLYLEQSKWTKINAMKRHTWGNFRNCHIKLFKEINGS